MIGRLNISSKSFENRSVPDIITSVRKNDHTGVVLALEKNPQSINHTDDIGRTPLHIACHLANKTMIFLLLEYDNIDVCLKDSASQQPIDIAIHLGRKDLVDILFLAKSRQAGILDQKSFEARILDLKNAGIPKPSL